MSESERNSRERNHPQIPNPPPYRLLRRNGGNPHPNPASDPVSERNHYPQDSKTYPTSQLGYDRTQKGTFRGQRRTFEGYGKGVLEQATSFYFTNFPEDWEIGEMWKTFIKCGRVIQVYVARKKDKWGRCFGFVRYLEVKNVREMEAKLNEIKVGKQLIRANVARFSKYEDMKKQKLNRLLQESKLKQGLQDSWSWKHESKGTYSTKSAYILLRSNNGEPDSRRFSMLWNNKVPLKVSAFVWKVMQNRIPTGDNLLKRGIVGSETDFTCILCGKHTETVSHLFFTCDASWAIWQAAYAWWGLRTVLSCDGWKHLQQHVGMVQNRKAKDIWNVIWFTTIWSIWLWRNQLIFKEGNDKFATVLDLIKLRSLNWIKAKQNMELTRDLWFENPRGACN